MTHARRGRTVYGPYLQSAAWQRVRRATLNDRGAACEACGSSEQLNVHHVTYERLGREGPDDLRVLCEPCHLMAHALAELSSRLTLAEATDATIERVRLYGRAEAWSVLNGQTDLEEALRRLVQKRTDRPKWQPTGRLKVRATRGLVVRQMTEAERERMGSGKRK